MHPNQHRTIVIAMIFAVFSTGCRVAPPSNGTIRVVGNKDSHAYLAIRTDFSHSEPKLLNTELEELELQKGRATAHDILKKLDALDLEMQEIVARIAQNDDKRNGVDIRKLIDLSILKSNLIVILSHVEPDMIYINPHGYPPLHRPRDWGNPD